MRLSLREGVNCCLATLALATCAGLSGCGGASTGTVSGKVLYNGTPLKGGNVTFVPEAQGEHSIISAIGEDGSYSVEKVPVGAVKITVETKSLKPKTNVPAYAPPPGSPGGYQPPDPNAMAKRYVAIPDSYSDPEKSGLTCTVKGGSQPYDITLK